MKFSRKQIIVLLVFLLFVIFRFWDIEGRMQFSWDQVKNSWVMKDMLVDRVFPLEGMEAKLNSGFKIGPAYYYLLAPFYAVFNLDPIASGVFAGVVAVASAWVLFALGRTLFSREVALVALVIYTFSFRMIQADRIAWPVIFIPPVSLFVFYYLSRLLSGSVKEVPKLALALGFSLHVHFTALFYFIYSLLVLPFVLKSKKFWRAALTAAPLFLVWLIPLVLAGTRQNVSYVSDYYHGFHFMRVYQLIGDALIEFSSIVGVTGLSRILQYVTLPLFMLVYYLQHKNKTGLRFLYLIAAWFAVPLLVFAVYRGEISDYYFSVTRPVALLIYAYLTVAAWRTKKAWLMVAVAALWLYIGVCNVRSFVSYEDPRFTKTRAEVKDKVESAQIVSFTEGDPASYFYYLFTRQIR